VAGRLKRSETSPELPTLPIIISLILTIFISFWHITLSSEKTPCVREGGSAVKGYRPYFDVMINYCHLAIRPLITYK